MPRTTHTFAGGPADPEIDTSATFAADPEHAATINATSPLDCSRRLRSISWSFLFIFSWVQLSQIILFVHDTARVMEFYAQLGLAVLDGDAASGFVRLRDPSGGAVLALHFTRAVGPPSGPRVDTALKPCFRVDDIDVARATLVAQGATMRDVHRFDTIAFCDGIDPEGNIFQLTTR